MNTPDRLTKRTRKGKLVVYVRIAKLLHTPVSGVKTAVLDCGARLRYDVNRRRASQRYMVCPACTEVAQIERQRRTAAGGFNA